MANNFDSNFTRKLARVILKGFEHMRTVSKNVNTQLLAGKFDPTTGANVDFKRPTDYRSYRTAAGDISGVTENDIITGKATGTVQNYITVSMSYTEADEAIKLDQKDELVNVPAAQRIVMDLELDFSAFMMKNAGLLGGAYGTAVDAWADVAEWGAVMASKGVPRDAPWYAMINPYTQSALANVQRSLGAADQLVSQAYREATIADNVGGLRVMTGTTLSTHLQPTTADRAGAINGTPTVTYVGHKDTMIQSIPVNGFGTFTGTIPAGTMISIAGRNQLNLATRQPIVNGAGAQIIYTGVLTADAALTSGAGTFLVSGPAIFEANGQYNTTATAIANADVVTLLGADATLYQPNLFWHKNAFAIGSVPMRKLHSTDTIATTSDGLQLRVSKGVGFLENLQRIRIDFRPAYAVLNPFFAGQGFGLA